jgi:cystathionine gamma-lyase/homocysteine desulfhydrase
MRFNSKLIHGGPGPDPLTGAVTVPIYQVSTYRQDGVGKHKGYEYSRTGNPTRAALEQLIAELEGGGRGFAFSSGMAALSTVLMLFDAGDHLVVGDDVYGGTFRVLTKVFDRFGIRSTFVDSSEPGHVAASIEAGTRAVLVETPSNPLLKVTDLAAVAEICRQKGALLIVDNTFMTPYFQRPLELGADIVVHSATKYLGGHSDVVAGLAVVKDSALGERLHFLQNAVGGVLPPNDSWLLIRGIKTLAVRMKEHEANARTIVEWLMKHPKVRKVYYPGLADHPGHAVAARQATGFGGMISFEVGDGALADQALERAKVFMLAESLGAVESLISLPAKMTHASIPAARRQELGISDGLIRVSVGIEDVQDLIDDLGQALA